MVQAWSDPMLTKLYACCKTLGVYIRSYIRRWFIV